jgi:hypothetical protein
MAPSKSKPKSKSKKTKISFGKDFLGAFAEIEESSVPKVKVPRRMAAIKAAKSLSMGAQISEGKRVKKFEKEFLNKKVDDLSDLFGNVSLSKRGGRKTKKIRRRSRSKSRSRRHH